MSELLRSYLLSVVAVSLLASVLLSLVPKGGVHKTLAFLCGLALILVAIGPVARLDFADLSRRIAQLSLPSTFPAEAAKAGGEELTAAIIKEKTESYIWDKAGKLGMSVRVRVTVKTDDGCPYPYSVSIRGRYSRRQKSQLERELAANLAIPSQRQEWSTDE